ncbi:MAG: OmpA family protein [bacterium]
MPRKKSPGAIQVGSTAPGWMVTYGDLMTQLLIFFVMMFALASAMNELQLLNLKKKMKEYVVRDNLTEDVSFDIDERGLVVSFHGRKMYDKGGSRVKEKAVEALRNLAAFVRPQPNQIRIEGHADSAEVSPEYPSHWELSVTRAAHISQFLIDDIYFPPSRISSAGYAEQKPFIDEKTRETLFKRRNDLLKTARDLFLFEVKKMLVRKKDEKIIAARSKFLKKYAGRKKQRVLADFAVRNYRGKITKKFDKIFEEIRKDKGGIFGDHSKKWVDALTGAQFEDFELEILEAKEVFIKAQYFKKLQKEIVEMANLSPAQQDRNRRVDIIISRISSGMGKKRIL